MPGHADMDYVLITAARNEEALIEATIRSVIAQTARPSKWIIVSDGSTDRTDDIVRRQTAEHPWLMLHRMPELRDRSFAAKANCFNAGYELVRSERFDLIGNLDADITIGPDYYEFLLGKFTDSPRLGVAGTPYVDEGSEADTHTYAHAAADLTHVSGACQMFRRACFEDVGGYVPIKGGGIDWVAVTTARMRGWTTRTYLDRVCIHHRKMGTAHGGPLAARFRHGREDYYLGGHPLWQLFRCVFQMRNPPYVLGGAMLLLGYVWAFVSRVNRPISDELIAFHRKEQLDRLRALLLPRHTNRAR